MEGVKSFDERRNLIFPGLSKCLCLSPPIGSLLDFPLFIHKSHSFFHPFYIEVVHIALGKGDSERKKMLLYP